MNRLIPFMKNILNTCWITGSPPPVEGEYIVTINGGTAPLTLWYIDYKWIDNNDNEYHTETAWMPLPDAYSSRKEQHAN